MATKTRKQENNDLDIAESFSKTERYIDENKKSLGIIAGAIILVVGGYFAYTTWILGPKEKEAAEQIYVAERYFEKDSLELALKGDGNYPGFLQIIDDYGMTGSANLAHYYAGIIYLRQGEFQKAIDYLKDYDADDQMTRAMSLGAIGDAYSELGNMDDAISYYDKAATSEPNQFTSPMFLLKKGISQEAAGKHKQALETYRSVKQKYPESAEGRDIDRYIGKLEAMNR
ncbi:MAG: tetratricopeptide repeat protein [Bacteroidia bacterium]